MIVIRNTYPRWQNCPHAEPGDVCRWEKSHGRMSLVRESDGKTIYSRDLLSPGQHDGDRPVDGVIAKVASKGWFLEVTNTEREGIAASRTLDVDVLTCSDCGGVEFNRGASGGNSENVRCRKCGQWWNDMGPFGLERIHGPNKEVDRDE